MVKNSTIILSGLAYTCVLGAGLYEHVSMVPNWSAAPPMSLSMFAGKYGLDAAPFWKMIHPVVLLLMITALVSNWNTGRRKTLLLTMTGYVLVLLITFIYFVPELISITTTPYQDFVDPSLQERASTWERLSIARLFIVAILGFSLLYSLTKPIINPTRLKA